MKKLMIVFISLIFLVSTLVPAYAQRRSRFGRKARTAAIIAGGAGAGALIGGKKGAAIGGGGAGLYAFNRRAARRHFKGRTRTIGTVASGTALGAGVGGAAGHGKGAAIGAAVGAGSSYIYSRSRHATTLLIVLPGGLATAVGPLYISYRGCNRQPGFKLNFSDSIERAGGIRWNTMMSRQREAAW